MVGLKPTALSLAITLSVLLQFAVVKPVEAQEYNAAYDTLGVFVPSQIDDLKEKLGRSYIKYGLIFGGSNSSYLNNEQLAQWARRDFWEEKTREGVTMVLDIMPAAGRPDSSQFNTQQQELTQERACQIADAYEVTLSGGHDSGYADWARTLISIGQTNAIIRIGSEYDGHWHPYSVIGKCNTARYSGAQYYNLAFKRIHGIFEGVAAESGQEVNFRYDMNGAGFIDSSRYNFDDAYPGDEYVDFIGTDMYNNPIDTYENHPGRGNSWETSGKPLLTKYTDFAREHGLKFSMPEWGMWAMENGWNARGSDVNDPPCSEQICGDNPFYIQALYDFFNENADIMGYHIYYHHITNKDAPGAGTEHRLWYSLPDGEARFVNSAAKFLELYGGDIDPGTPSSPLEPPGDLEQIGYYQGGIKPTLEGLSFVDDSEIPENQACNNGSGQCDINNLRLVDRARWLLDLLSLAVIPFATISVVISGIQYSSSGGSPEKAAEAKSRIAQTLIGLIVYIFLWSLLQYLLPGNILG